MPITNRTLEPGTVLIATYKKVLHRCEVVASDAGPRYRLDGVDHKSPSTAASAVVGGNRNGWTFWSVEGSAPEVPLAIAPVAATFRKTPNQKGVADGGTRWTARPARRASSSRPTKRPSPARRATPRPPPPAKRATRAPKRPTQAFVTEGLRPCSGGCPRRS